jgi:hypothetical protein
MIPLRRSPLLLVGLCLLLGPSATACGATHHEDTSPCLDQTGGERLLARGRRSARSGDHLRASRYLEAAWSAGAEEIEVLPELLAAQVRSGRLRAARLTLIRLRELVGTCPNLDTIEALIDEIDPAGRSPHNSPERSPR